MNTNIGLSSVSVFPLTKLIKKLVKECEDCPEVISICKKYTNMLSEGQHAVNICKDFVTELSRVNGSEMAQKAAKAAKKSLKSRERDIDNTKHAYALYRGELSYVAESIGNKLAKYMVEKSDANRNDLRESLNLFSGNPDIKAILENLGYDEYEISHGKKLENMKTIIKPAAEKTFTKAEVDEIVSRRIAESKADSQKIARSYKDIDTHIMLDKTVRTIMEACGSNKKLNDFCMQYFSALNNGVSEESLYESFISGVSGWNYLPAVETEISALNNRVSKYKQEIDLKKILEVMSQTGSYYIVPLIEDCVMTYVDNKSMTNKAVLKQRLQAFEYDPFVRDIENAVMYDLSLPNTVYLGESVESKNGYLRTEMVFSPVQYIKENESIFCIKDIFYVKKGNSISRLPRKEYSNLSESFVSLCRLVNSPNVEIHSETNSISVYDGSDKAVINESGITVNGERKTPKEIDGISAMSTLMNEHKESFYAAVKTLNERFNDIAYIDFVKHVSLNENEGRYVDVFKVKNNLFVTVVDKADGITTLYKNVNPIQCRNYINEHLQINADAMFEDMLPSQSSIIKMINEQKALYEGYLEELADRENELKALKDESAPEMAKVIDDALAIVADEKEKTSADYAEYTKQSDDFINGKDSDADKSTDTDAAEYADSEHTATETPDEMTNPVDPETNPEETETDSDLEHGMETDDSFGENPFDGETANSLPDNVDDLGKDDAGSEFDGILDTPEVTDSESNDQYKFKVVNISYHENIKSGSKDGKGEVVLMIPSVDANGDIHNEMKRISFYLDNKGNPVINNEYMPLDMYMEIVDAIKSEPATANISSAGSSDIDNADFGDTDNGEEEFNFDDLFKTDDDTDGSEKSVSIISMPTDGNEGNDSLDGRGDGTFDIGGLETTPVDSDDMTKPVDKVDRESPDETRDAEDSPSYPIDVPLNMEDIKPIGKKEFQDDLDSAGIKHSESESNGNDICFTISDKAQARWLHNYFKEWKGYSTAEFCNFFPELKKCFDNKGSIPTMKLESMQETVRLILPYNDAYGKIFKAGENHGTHISILAENAADLRYIYENLKSLSKKMKLDEDAKSFIRRYERDIAVNESDICIGVPYNSFFEQKLSCLGYSVKRTNEGMQIECPRKSAYRLSALMESFYKEAKPISVRNFISSLNEGVKITVEAGGKTVTIDTDDMERAEGTNKEKDQDDIDNFDPSKSFEQVTTFDGSNMNPYTQPDNDDKDDDKDDEKDDEKGDDKKGDDKKGDDKKGEKEGKKGGKKIVIKKKQKGASEKDEKESANEALREMFDEMLTESLTPEVMDNVRMKNGATGQIIYQMANGNFIINCCGHTMECGKNDFTLLTDRVDTVEAPYKFDPATLKGLFEQLVHCGMFMNDMRITPNDCFITYSEYLNAKDSDTVRVIVEGEATQIERKYIRILEDLNNFANVNDYKEITVNESGAKAYVNAKDMQSKDTVRALVESEGEWHFVTIDKTEL